MNTSLLYPTHAPWHLRSVERQHSLVWLQALVTAPLSRSWDRIRIAPTPSTAPAAPAGAGSSWLSPGLRQLSPSGMVSDAQSAAGPSRAQMAGAGMCLPCPGKGAHRDPSPSSSTDQTLLPAPAFPNNPSTFPSFAEGCQGPGALGRAIALLRKRNWFGTRDGMSPASHSVPCLAKPALSQLHSHPGHTDPSNACAARTCLCLPLEAWPKILPGLKLSFVPSRS